MARGERDLIFKEKFGFGESTLDVLIGGMSLLDSKQGLSGQFKDLEAADLFLKAYGYDLSDPIEAAELKGTIQEAVRFIRRYFLKPENPDGLDLEVPKKFSESVEIQDLLMSANSNQNPMLRNWACAILKVVHTISHMDRDLRHNYFTEIQKQIFDRFYKYLHRSAEGQLYMGRFEGDPLRVNLIEFQTKPKKSRESTLMKLLHKPESVAEEVFDRVGLRLVTKTRVDSVRVIHFLDQARVVVSANIKPSRSRNTLIDTADLQKKIQDVIAAEQIPQSLEGELEFLKTLEDIQTRDYQTGQNPFRSEHYRAIQFTCRQLIKIKNPVADQVRELKGLIKNFSASEDSAKLLQAVERIDLRFSPKVVRFFYPYEVQVMDEESYHENEKGRSAHGEYKKAQQQAAMVRVMGALANEFVR